jgi:hypothetical protein
MILRLVRRPGIILALFVFCQLPFLFQPIQGLHKWRQADTAAVSRNLAWEDPNPLYPRIDLRGDGTGITGMEFPLYQIVVAAGLRVAGDQDAVGRVVSLIATIAAWLALVRLLVRRAGLDPWAAHGALAACPLLFVYACRVMPEMLALLLAVVALERFDAARAANDPAAHTDQRALWVGTLALALAALIRPYLVFVGLPLAWWWLGDLRRFRPGWRWLAAGTAAAIPFLAWHFWWSPHLITTYGIDYFFRGRPLLMTVAEITYPEFWGTLLATICQHYLGYLTLPFALWGGFILWRHHRAGSLDPRLRFVACWMPAISVAVLILLIGSHFSPHHYYFLVLVPWAALLLATGLDAWRRRFPRLGVATCIACSLAIPAVLWHHYRHDRHLDAYDQLSRELAHRTAPDDRIAIEDRGSYVWHLHPIRRRGWVEPRWNLRRRSRLRWLEAHGCRWVAWYDGQRYQLASIADRIAAAPR